MDLTLIEDSTGNLVVNETATSITVSEVAGTSIEVPAAVVNEVIEIVGAPLARGIADFARTSGDGSVGTVDTYTISYTDGTTSTFTVRNGSAGAAGYTEFIQPSGDTSGVIDQTAIQGAFDSGKSVRLVNGATYNVTGLVLKTGTRLYMNGANIRLANNSNADVITSQGFAGLAGGGTNGGIHSFGVYGPGTVDGNRANQTFTTSLPTVTSANFNLSSSFTVQLSSTSNLPNSGRATVNTQSGPQYFDWSANNTGTNTLTASAPGTGRVSTGSRIATSGYGIRVYGYNFYIGGNINIKNCVADGLWTEWGSGNIGPGSPEMESLVTSVKCWENNRNGYSALGPHDSFIRDVVCFRNTEYGLNEGGGSVHQISGFHGWGSPQRVSAAIRNQSTLVDCVFEVTSASGSRGLEIYGNKIKSRASRVLQSAGSSGGQVGVEMLNNASGCDLDFQFDGGFANGAVRLHSTGGGNKVRAVVNDNAANALVQGVALAASDDYWVIAGSGTTAASVTTALDKKSNTGHTHAASDITSGIISTARLGSGTADSTTFLRGDGTWQVVTSGGGSSTLAGLTDVSITSPASAQVLRHDGTNWKNTALVIGDVTNLSTSLAALAPINNPTFTGTSLTLADAQNFVLGTTTGTKIGTSNSQKIGFLNATPVTQQAVGTDLGSVLSNFGLRQGGQSYILNTSGQVTFSGLALLSGAIRYNISNLTASSTIAAAYQYTVDATSGAVVVTLSTTTSPGLRHIVKRIDSSANAITVVTASGGNIDGQTSISLPNQWDWIEVTSTSTSNVWRVVGGNKVAAHNHDGVYEPFQASGTTDQYRRGDKTWQPVADLPVSTATQSALNLKAADNAVVKLTGAQTLAGTKTFSDAPVVPDGSFSIAKTINLQSALDSLDANKSATPVTGTKAIWQFKFTDSTVARPTTPAYVSLNWVGPAGSGGAPPANMANDDSWDMTP